MSKSLQNLLKAIEEMPWSMIGSSIGNCQFAPEALKGIIHEESEERKKFYWQLDNHIVVQGALYEGAFFVIPFLIEFLKEPSLEHDRSLLLLYEIANGASSNSIAFQSIQTEGFEYFIPFPNRNKIPLQIACRNQILCSVDIFLQDVANLSSKTRVSSLELCMSFSEHIFYIRNFLQHTLKNESDPKIASKIVKALEEYG